MSELALRLIEENKKTKDTFLDLGKCGLEYELPKKLLDCVWLEKLCLMSSQNLPCAIAKAKPEGSDWL
ncbi:hypothetical protein [Emticicia fontis]